MTGERASPVCYGAEADDIYMGYAGHDELLAALNELLEAERAGARVALESIADAIGPDHAAMMCDIRADEARWCAMLSRQIRRLGGTASRKCGAFHGKAWPSPIRSNAWPFSTAVRPGWSASSPS